MTEKEINTCLKISCLMCNIAPKNYQDCKYFAKKMEVRKFRGNLQLYKRNEVRI